MAFRCLPILLTWMVILFLQSCTRCPSSAKGNQISISIFDKNGNSARVDTFVIPIRNLHLANVYQLPIDVERNFTTYVIYSNLGIDTLFMTYNSSVNFKKEYSECGMQFYITDFKARSTFRLTEVREDNPVSQTWKITLRK